MDEIIKLVTEKVGIPADKAQQAVETVLGFVKDKLPAPIADQVTGLLEGGAGGVGDALGGITDKLGGMFGKGD